MININESDKQVQLLGLRSKHLIGASKTCQHLRAIYKFGTGSGGDPCPLCEFAARTLMDDRVSQARPLQCELCPWMLLEAKTCCNWLREWFQATFNEPCRDTVFQMQGLQRSKEPRFRSIRIKMLDKWVRRLNALAKRAEKRERSSK